MVVVVDAPPVTFTILPETAPASATKGKPRRGIVLAVAAAAAAALVAGGFVVVHLRGDSTPTPSVRGDGVKALADLPAATILARANSAALHKGTVHTDIVLVANRGTSRISEDNGQRMGTQSFTFGKARAAVRVVGSTTYFQGNRAALSDYMGLPASYVPAAGRWFRLRPGDPAYAVITEGITLSETVTSLKITGPFTVIRGVTKNGIAVVGVRGAPTSKTLVAPGATATVWIAASGAPVFVEYDYQRSAAEYMTVRFSSWGVPLKVRAPASSKPAPN
jgi:hypothetical protein